MIRITLNALIEANDCTKLLNISRVSHMTILSMEETRNTMEINAHPQVTNKFIVSQLLLMAIVVA